MILSLFILISNKFDEHVYSTFTVLCQKSRIVSLTPLITKNIVVFPAYSRFHSKLICFWSTMDYFLLAQNCWNQLLLATSCVVITLTNSNFSNVIRFSYVIFYWLLKTVLPISHIIVVFISIFGGKNPVHPVLSALSSNNKTKRMLAP